MKCPGCGHEGLVEKAISIGSESGSIDECPKCHLQSSNMEQMSQLFRMMEGSRKPDGNVHVMPRAEKDTHIESPNCFCEPELIGDYRSTGGCRLYMHREKQ